MNSQPLCPLSTRHRARTTSINAILNDDHFEPSPSTSNSNVTATKAGNLGDGTHYPLITTNSGGKNNATIPQSDKDKERDTALAIDHDFVTRLHDDVCDRTTGCSVEQLEQVNSVLMDTVWRTRYEWNRSRVAICVAETFNRVLEDMEECGWEFGPSSWGRRR